MRLYAAKLPDIDPEHRAPRRKETLEEYQRGQGAVHLGHADADDMAWEAGVARCATTRTTTTTVPTRGMGIRELLARQQEQAQMTPPEVASDGDAILIFSPPLYFPPPPFSGGNSFLNFLDFSFLTSHLPVPNFDDQATGEAQARHHEFCREGR